MNNKILEKIQILKVDKIPFCLVTLVNVRGSAPQDMGAKMIVSKDGLLFGTIGGGKIKGQCSSRK